MATITEYSCQDEQFARDKRRALIEQGAAVSLIAYDPSRDLYVFNHYPQGE